MDATEKTLTVLDSLGAGERADRLTDIAERAGLPRSTVHRILQRLVERGYATSAGDGRYLTGPRVLALAGDALARLGHGYVTPALERLRDEVGATVHFAVLTGDEATYTEKLEDPAAAYQMASRVGMRIPLHCTAIGKAILAALPPADARLAIERLRLERHTDRTLTSAAELEDDLARIRARGYAIDDEENELTIRCVGAAVLDARELPVGAVSVSALTFDMPPERPANLAPQILAAAADISRSLGSSSGRGPGDPGSG